MIAVLKNNAARIWENKIRIIVMFSLIFVMVGVALYMTSHQKATVQIAFVGDKADFPVSSDVVHVTYVKKQPEMADFVSGKYDASIEKNDQSKIGFVVKTIKNAEYQKKMENFLKDPTAVASFSTNKRGTGQTVIGYLLMFLLMTSVTNMFIFSEDKEKHLFERIAVTPVSFNRILLAHSIFSFSLLFFPTMFLIFLGKFIFQVEIGFDFLQYAFLIGIVCLFATSYSLFNASLFPSGDTANMLGSTVVVVTTMLSGSFLSFENGNRWLDAVIKVLPQKKYLDIVASVESHTTFSKLAPNLTYLLLITAIFFMIAIVKTKRDYVNK